MDAVVSAEDDMAVVAQCNHLTYHLTCALSRHGNRGTTKELEDDKGASEVHEPTALELLLVSSRLKRCLLRRLTSCDGLLACHAIQGCLRQHVSTCAAAAAAAAAASGRDDASNVFIGELEDWLQAVLDAIVECLSQARDRRAAARQLRCATILLQLCSTILKDERGASHPERTPHPAVPPTDKVHIGSPTDTAPAGGGTKPRGRESLAAQACANVANVHLCAMVRGATALMADGVLVGEADARGIEGSVGGAGADAVFWVLSLVSDVLKYCRKRQWCFGDPEGVPPVGRKRRRQGRVVGRSIGVDKRVWAVGAVDDINTNANTNTDTNTNTNTNANTDTNTNDNANANANTNTDTNTSANSRDARGGVVPPQLDVVEWTRVIGAVPVGLGIGTVDTSLKWLEVTQLLIDAAEERWRPALADIFCWVPRILWRLSSRAESLMLAPESSRSPGSAFVEEDGATGALAQAMLSIVFKMIRLEHERGLLTEQGGAAIEPIEDRERKSNDAHERRKGPHRGGEGAVLESLARRGQSQTRRPWTTIVEALTATVAGSAEGVSRLGFAGRLVRLFCDQDDALVGMMLTNLHIFLNARPREDAPGGDCGGKKAGQFPPELREIYHGDLHPAKLFAALLSEVRFDSGVLLDWLISPETSFLPYLTLLLRLAVAEWSEFAARVSCAGYVAPPKMCSDLHAPDGVEGSEEDFVLEDPGEELVLEDSEEELVLEDSGEKLVLKDSKEELVLEDSEEELVLTEEEAERLGRTVSCLSGLVASVRGLERNGLMPFNLSPLLRRIGQVVSLYEECCCDDAPEEEDD